MKFRDLTGQKFQMLTALKLVGRNERRQTLWLFRCDCGTEKVLWGASVAHGYTKSCGCWQKANPARLSHGMAGGSTFRTWAAMRQRCTNPENPSYPDYGGRGITVCERWGDFAVFLADMGERPVGASIDRIDNSRGYEPGNCRWATATVQNRNRRTSIMVEHAGETLHLKEWASRIGVSYKTLWNRYRVGARGAHLLRPTA